MATEIYEGLRNAKEFGSVSVGRTGLNSAFYEGFDGAGVAVSAAGTGRIRYNNTTKLWEQSLDGAAWTTLGGASAIGATTLQVNQVGHGFVVGNVVRSSGVANTYTKAKADTKPNAEVIGIVTVVTDANNFTLSTEGIITAGVPAGTVGAVYYLDPTTAGALTTTEPLTIGQVSKPVLVLLQSAAKALFINFRGVENVTPPATPYGLSVGGTGATNAANARTNLGLGSMATQNANAVAITGGTATGISEQAMTGRMKGAKGIDVVAANDLTLGTDGNFFIITGNTQINAIATSGWQAGAEVTLLFTGTPTVKHNTAGAGGFASFLLHGSVDLAAANNTILKLIYDGTNWQQTSPVKAA